MLVEFKIDEINTFKAPLDKDEIFKYNIEECFKNVKKKIKEFKLKQSRYPEYSSPIITSNYNIRYECFVSKINRPTERSADLKDEIQNLYSDFVIALRSFTKNEFHYFNSCLYHNNSANSVINDLNTTYYLFKEIKESCIVKLAMALEVEVLKD